MCLFGGFFGEVGAVGGVDDASGGVDEEAATIVHTKCCNVFKAAALCANAGDEEEVVGGYLADLLELVRLCCAAYKHYLVGVAPTLTKFQGLFKNVLV